MNQFSIEKSKTNSIPVAIGEDKELDGFIANLYPDLKKRSVLTDSDYFAESEIISEDTLYVVSLGKENFKDWLHRIENEKNISWILAPKSPEEFVYNGGVPYFTYPGGIFISLTYLVNLTPDDFFELIAFSMRLGLEYSTNLYGFIINNLYELCDLDKDVLAELAEMIYKLHARRLTRLTKEERTRISLLELLGEFYDSIGDFKRSDAIAFGCINGAYYSYVKEQISTDDYYEIRDMFVPFGISITQTKYDKPALKKQFHEFLSGRETASEYFAMKRIGKLDIPLNPLEEMEETVFEAVYFDENAND